MHQDLTGLPDVVQASARIDANGEVSWPESLAAAAVDGLRDNGCIVLGLDLRFYYSDGRFVELAWSSFNPDESSAQAVNAEAGCRAAHEALDKIGKEPTPDGIVERRILITWE